eukprot:gb/GECH01014820.1/.p1 GENE.gb/GECH01014820.1/~~gb/GECH01014820.1/.p1  ORF type:complete len:472 (+),score=149.14 gb/GECH01014820.1/:1-1416(+)
MSEIAPNDSFLEDNTPKEKDEHDALNRALFAIQDKIHDHEKSIWALRRKFQELEKKTIEQNVQAPQINDQEIESFKKVANMLSDIDSSNLENNSKLEEALHYGKEAFRQYNWKDYEFKIERKARIRNLQAQKDLWQSLYKKQNTNTSKGAKKKKKAPKPSTESLLSLTSEDIERQRESDQATAESKEQEQEQQRAQLLQAAQAPNSIHHSDHAPDNTTNDSNQSDLGLSVFKPIGYLDSVYKNKHGAPRQGSVTSAAKARFTIDMNQVGAALEGLEDFSHIWVIFVFHLNNRVAVKSKIRPPRLKGKRLGLFATRTPHRPNPIGITLAKLDTINHATGTVTISGMDLLDGTPILDIKPFVPSYDNVKTNELKLPNWVTEHDHVKTVDFTSESLQQIQNLISENKLDLCDEYEQAKECVRQVVQSDPRPGYMQEREGDHDFVLDRMHVYYHIGVDQATVTRIEFEDPVRTKE